MGADEQKIYDLVAKRFLAIFHPEAVYERTRVETTVEEHAFRTSGRRLLEPGWKSVYGEEAADAQQADDDTGGDQMLPKLEQGEQVDTVSVESLRKETQPPRRYTEASLLAAMETAGKDIEDSELREAMKESGIGTPATRAAIIERLLSVGYLERDGRALHATEKGVQVIRLLGEHPLTSPQLTGEWEKRLELIAEGEESRPSFMNDIAKFTESTVQELDKLKGVKIERANLGPCPVCGKDVIENRKGYSCWTKDDPGCGFVIWKKKAGKNLQASVVKELMASLKASIERGDDPAVGRTEKQVTGFRGRSGRSFRAKLRVEPWTRDDGSQAWRVEFDEEWANQPRATPPAEDDGDANGAAAKEKVSQAEALAAGGDAEDAEAKLEPERASR
jgi:DNA topoisomerase-3